MLTREVNVIKKDQVMITKEEAQRAYAQLLSFRRQEVLVKSKDFPGRVEVHHIIPLSMGGLDIEENKIVLLAKEHFMAHVYLWIIHRFGKFHKQSTFALIAMHKGTLNGSREELRDFILMSEEYQQAREDFSKFVGPITSKANLGSKNPSFGKHWYKDPNSTSCQMFYDGKQPNGWIRGKHATKNELISRLKILGKVWITNYKTKENQLVNKEKAAQLIAGGEWKYGRIQKPISEIGLANIRASFKNRRYSHQQPYNKNKLKYINPNTNEIRYFAKDEQIPLGFVKTKRKQKIKKSNQKQINKEAWLQETQAMADYYTEYGYEATCKKFSVSMSQESMLMRFIRCRKLYGIRFESMRLSGKKREFKIPPEENPKN